MYSTYQIQLFSLLYEIFHGCAHVLDYPDRRDDQFLSKQKLRHMNPVLYDQRLGLMLDCPIIRTICHEICCEI